MAGGIITFSGKGGVGKTSLASLVLREFVRLGRRPILAVDADPNATLGMTLGVEVQGTMADLREDMEAAAQKPTEISKTRLMDQLLAELLVEEKGFDLLTMGRPEGPKCYCYVNGLLRRYLTMLRANYAHVLVDCEAGMEYLSRLVVDDVETIVFVAEPTRVGLRTVERIGELADSLPMKVRRRLLALNKVRPDCAVEPGALAELSRGFEAVVQVPYDEGLFARAVRGEPLDDTVRGPSQEAVQELARLCVQDKVDSEKWIVDSGRHG